MFAIFFEILAVISGIIALVVSMKLNPKTKLSSLMISSFYETKNCSILFKILMSLFYIFNTIAFYLYVGPLGILFIIGLLSVITKPTSNSHLLSSFIVIFIYSFVNIIHNYLIPINYLPFLAFFYVMNSYIKTRSNTIGLIFLIFSTSVLMLINVLVIF
jgi:hypothetical protein